jgi:HEAT repeat protein
MRLEELEEMMTEEPAEAEAAIAEMAAAGHVDQLALVAKAARVNDLKLHAIEQLGNIGSPEASAALVEMLEAVNTLTIGGTEQRMERAAVQARLVRALARARGINPPAVRSQRDIEEFIESIRNG